MDPNWHETGLYMSSMNPAYLGQYYRYAYACGAQRPCNFFNTLTKVEETLKYDLYKDRSIVTFKHAEHEIY